MNKHTTDNPCFHCGLPVPAGLDIHTKYQGEDKAMCCYGCQAVSQAIIDSGMDDFYKFRTSNPQTPQQVLPEFLQQLKAYDSASIQKKFVNKTELDASDGKALEVSLILEGITCAACVWLNEKHLNSLDGVLDASINYSNHRARVRWDNSKIQLSDILESISRIGYLAHPYDPEQHQRILENERKQQLKRLGLSGLLGMQIMIFAVAMYSGDWWVMDETFKQSFRWISLALTTPLLLFASSVFFKSAYRDIINKRIGMDVPISLGIAIAFLASLINTIKGSGHIYYDSVAMFTFFLLTARFFELSTRKRTSEATEELLKLTPAVATRITGYQPGQEESTERNESIAVAELNRGDYLLVRPGETIPTDGIISSGTSGINESLITGESLPLNKGPGENVIGGSHNTENPLIIEVTNLGADSVLSSIQRLIDEAQHSKPAIAKLADKIASWFVSLLLSITAIVAFYWYKTDPSQWLEITIATLVVSCPCALSLATPAAITAASGQLARIGLLPKGSHALETLAHATDFVFDKTGTLTEGKIDLVNIQQEKASSAEDKTRVLLIAASLEAHSEHPLAKALLNANHEKLLTVSDLQHQVSMGIQGIINNTLWFIGNKNFVEEHCGRYFRQGDETHTNKIYLASKDDCVATFVLSDPLRKESKNLITLLHKEHKKIHLLSGDHNESSRLISEQCGIENYQGNLKPEDKLHYVKNLQDSGAIVVMTGDGINDAPVLAGAELSIAMSKGTQLAAATADMILISNNIEHIFHGYVIAKKTLSIIKQNLGWALLYNVIAIPAAATGYVEPWLAAIGMSTSSLVVVLNALRLNRMKF